MLLHARYFELPVEMMCVFAVIQLGTENPTKTEKPNTKRFLVEFRLTNCRFDTPTAVTMPENEAYKMRP